jgi:hypothetical protein
MVSIENSLQSGHGKGWSTTKAAQNYFKPGSSYSASAILTSLPTVRVSI